MGTPTSGATRLARAAAFGVATLALASGAHVSAGGALPSVPVLVLLTLPLTMAAVILTSRKCGMALLLSSLTAAQVLLHETLMALTAHVPGEMFVAEVGAHHGVHSLVSGQVSAHSASAMGDVALAGAEGWSGAMKAAHVVATIVTALLLARGEQALWQLVARLLPTLPRMPRLLSCGPRQTPVLLSLPALRPCLVSGGSGLRGPPAGFPATAQVL